MFIVDDDRKFILNIDNVTCIRLRGNEVQATSEKEPVPYILGRYASRERAHKVFEEMLKCVFHPLEDYDEQVMVTGGTSIHAASEVMQTTALVSMSMTYYMPKE